MLLVLGDSLSVPVTVVMPTAIPPGVCSGSVTRVAEESLELRISADAELSVDQRVIIDAAPSFRARGRVAFFDGEALVVTDVRYAAGDARASRRFRVALDVAWRGAAPWADGEPDWVRVPAQEVDFSASGMCFVMDGEEVPAVRDRIEVRLGLAHAEEAQWLVVAWVVRQERQDGQLRVAIAFLDVPVEAVAMVATSLRAMGGR